jgi:hypothetical protein
MLNLLLFCGTLVGFTWISFFRLPVFAFVLYQAIYFYYPQQRWWGYMVPNIGYSFISVVIMAAVFSLNMKTLNQQKILDAPPFRYFYLLVALYFITYFYSVRPELHMMFATNYIKLAIIMTLAYKLCNTKKSLDIILYGFIFGAWYLSFVAYQVGRQFGDRLAGVYTVDAPDVNFVGAALVPSLVICLYYFWIKNSYHQRFIFAIAGAFIANAMVLINSRGAYLGVGISIAYFMYHMFFSSFQRKYQKATTIFLLVAGLASLTVVMDQSSINRILSINESAEVDESRETASTRTVFWKAAWDMSKDFPLGTGYEGFSYYSHRYIPSNVNTGRSRNRAVHSTWFETLSEVGYLGLFLFILMLYSCFKTTKLTKKYLKEQNMVDDYFKIIALEGALIAFLVTMTFINRMRAEVLYWCILFICVAYNVYVVNNAKQENNSQK